MRLIGSEHKVFPLSFWQREGFKRIQRGWKNSERLVIRSVSYEEFLHKQINNKDVHVSYGATEDNLVDACSLRLYGYLAALN